MTFDELIVQAENILEDRQIARNAWAGSVAAALLSAKGNVYTGVNIDVSSGMGFCAEQAAIAAMIAAGESKIDKIVAVGRKGIMPPCGRCREFMNQIHDENIEMLAMVAPEQVVKLKDLLPFNWN